MLNEPKKMMTFILVVKNRYVNHVCSFAIICPIVETAATRPMVSARKAASRRRTVKPNVIDTPSIVAYC